jgi:hypothetical protein
MTDIFEFEFFKKEMKMRVHGLLRMQQEIIMNL